MAEQVFDYISAEQMCRVMNDLGFNATAERAQSGNVFIRSRVAGYKFLVLLNKMQNEPNYSTAQFFIGFTGTNWTQASANKWNRECRFVKAYLENDGALHLEFDIVTCGITRTYLRDCLAIWEALIDKFAKGV